MLLYVFFVVSPSTYLCQKVLEFHLLFFWLKMKEGTNERWWPRQNVFFLYVDGMHVHVNVCTYLNPLSLYRRRLNYPWLLRRGGEGACNDTSFTSPNHFPPFPLLRSMIWALKRITFIFGVALGPQKPMTRSIKWCPLFYGPVLKKFHKSETIKNWTELRNFGPGLETLVQATSWTGPWIIGLRWVYFD